MMKRLTISALALALLAAPAIAAEQGQGQGKSKGGQSKKPLNSTKAKASYGIGMSIGRSIQRDGLDVDPDLIAAGIRDVMRGNEPRLSQEQLQQAMQALQQQMAKQQQQQQKQQQEQQAAQAKKNKAKGKAFLAKNKKKQGVKVTDSGLQYEVLKKGKGKSPAKTDTVKAHYKGQHLNGEVFDSSYQRGQPATFQVNQLIKGWTEGLQKMKEGGKWKLYVPSDLAYGKKGQGPIGPNETLIFEVELLEVQPKKNKKGSGGGSGSGDGQ